MLNDAVYILQAIFKFMLEQTPVVVRIEPVVIWGQPVVTTAALQNKIKTKIVYSTFYWWEELEYYSFILSL